MPKYDVAFPVFGYATATVEASDEQAAIKKAIEEWDGETEDLNAYEKVIEGNVLCVEGLTEAEATLCEDDEDSAEAEGG